MNERYDVLAIDGDVFEFVEDDSTPYLKYKHLTWEEAVELCRLSFRQGFHCVLWHSSAEEVGGASDGETQGRGELHDSALADSSG